MVVEEEDLNLFAFVLLGNHFRLVLRRASSSLGHCIKPLLTGLRRGWKLVRRAVLESNGKPVAIARYLGIQSASVAGPLRALRNSRNAGKLKS